MKSRRSLALFLFLTLPAVFRATWRVYRNRSLEINQQAKKLRRTQPFRTAYFNDPGTWQRVAAFYARLLPFLPGGRCFRESLLLLDLWSRCGLSPKLFLGVQKDRNHRRFHAWIVTREGFKTTDQGHEIFWEG